MAKTYHVTPKNGQWQVKGGGNSKPNRVVNTQKEAISIATNIAKNQHGEVAIHGTNGAIRQKNSYGNDPCPPRDKR